MSKTAEQIKASNEKALAKFDEQIEVFKELVTQYAEMNQATKGKK
jgi:hypothetical protein